MQISIVHVNIQTVEKNLDEFIAYISLANKLPTDEFMLLLKWVILKWGIELVFFKTILNFHIINHEKNRLYKKEFMKE